MSYSINILVPNAVEPIYPTFPSSIILKNEIDDEFFKRYSDIWPFFSSISGIVYSLVQEMFEEYYGSFPLCESDFECCLGKERLPFELSEDVRENLTTFLVKTEYFEDFIMLIHFLLVTSPNKKIMFHTRYEGGDTEIILGVIKWDKFVNMLKEKQIYFNICYIVSLT